MNAYSLTAFEHTALTVTDLPGVGVLSETEAECLSLLSQQHRGFCTRGYRSMEFSQFCGLVNVGGRVLEILPKIGEHNDASQSRDVLLRLLHASPDFPLSCKPSASQGHRSSPLLDTFIRAFFEEVTLLIKAGLRRKHIEFEDDILAVRGTIMIQRQFSALVNRTDRIACRYDELTSDNCWNRILKAALRGVRTWIRAPDLQRKWMEIIAAFDEVADVPEGRSLLEKIRYDRQSTRYRPAVEWAQRILSLLSPNLRAGENSAPGLLFDMNRLFESVVEQHMRVWAWERDWDVESQDTTHHLARIEADCLIPAYRLRPDLRFTRRGNTVAIADAKWKRPRVSRRGFVLPDEADLYQLHSYSAVFGCENLALVFPWDERLSSAKDTSFELPGTGILTPRISVLFVDLDQLTLRRAWKCRNVRTHAMKLEHDQVVPTFDCPGGQADNTRQGL